MWQPAIAFRTEGGVTGGLGHVRRSVTLAHELRKQGIKVYFVVNHDRAVLDILLGHNFEAAEVGEDDERNLEETLAKIDQWGVNGLMIDSYRIRDVSPVRGHIAFTGVIDDLADRLLPVDLVINGAANAGELSYRTSSRTKLLLGPEYALLREEFSREPDRQIRAQVGQMLIMMGGADPCALTPRLMTWTREAMGEAAMDVVVGPFFTEDAVRQIEQRAGSDHSIILHQDPKNLRDLMLRCDVAIAGGGQTTYELAATGTPAAAIKLADNQSGNLRGLSAKNTLEWVGDVQDDDLEGRVIRTLRNLAEHADKRAKMSQAGRALVDGRGAARVAQAVLEACAR